MEIVCMTTLFTKPKITKNIVWQIIAVDKSYDNISGMEAFLFHLEFFN